MIEHSRLLELLDYDQAAGVFHWKRATKKVAIGDVAGCISNGRRVICVDLHSYQASRLAWFYVRGSWPIRDLDHRDYDPTNDRLCNLRLATPSQNGANRTKPKNNTSGFKGVFRSANGWIAKIGVRGKQYYLGKFGTPEEASGAYAKAAADHFGEFARAK